MSIVSEFKLQLPSEEGSEIIAYSVSHAPGGAMVAVALKKRVIFYGENGQIMPFSIQK
jgi:hypothetical protein